MGYFNELPNIAYQSPLSHKNSSKDFIIVKNLFRRTKLFDHLRGSATALNKVVIENGERPDTLADITKMKELGWEPKWTVKKFLDENGYEHKLQ